MLNMQYANALVLCGLLLSVTDAVEYRCDKTATHMTMTITHTKDAVVQKLTAFQENSGDITTSSCASSDVPTDTSKTQLIITTTLSPTQSQTSPNPTPSSCFLELPGPSGSTFVKYYIVAQKDPAYIQVSDTFYGFECDESNALGTIKALGAGQEISYSPTPVQPPVRIENVVIELYNGADELQTASTPVILGTPLKVRMTYTRVAVIDIPVGIHVHSLEVGSADDFATSLELLDGNGCVKNGLTAFEPASTFAPNTDSLTMDAATDTTFITETGLLLIAMFEGVTGTPVVWFRATWEASCYKGDENKCFNPQQYCTDQGGPAARRRRSTGNQPALNGTVTTSIPITLYQGTPSSQGGDGASDNSLAECKAARDFWIVAAVLGCLLLAVLLFSVFLFNRLKREQRRTDKLDSRFGSTNPSF